MTEEFDDDPNVIGPKSPKQKEFITSDAHVTVFGGAAGAGKALRNGTLILTKDGWIPVEKAHFGDLLPTPKEGTQMITGVHPQGVVDIYKVTLQDGATIEVCGNHLWKIRRAGDGIKRHARLVNTIELQEIIESESKKSGRKRWPLIDLCGDADLPELSSDLPLPAYVVGALLGDGGMTSTNTSFTTSDPELAEYIKSFGVEVKKCAGKYQYSIPGILDTTRELNIRVRSEYKHVPQCYKEASIKDRYAILQGLFDTDGTVDKQSRVSFCTTSPQLAEDVQDLVRSVGGTATISEKQTYFTNKFGDKVAGLPSFNLHIRHPDCSKLFTLGRKVSRCKKKVVSNRVVSVEYVCRDYATCISITGTDKQFIAEDYIVSHNSFLGVMDFLKYIHLPKFRGLITRRTTPQLKGPGGILDNAMDLYKKIDPKVRWKDKDGYFQFSSGARIYLRHFENLAAKDNFQGSEINEFLVDEGQQYEEAMVVYLMSRMRNPKCPEVTPHMKITCNPDYNSFLRSWIEWYLDPDTGIPIPERSGVKRWFITLDGKKVFADTREELVDKYGERTKPLSFRFIAANVYDNPVLVKNNPDYVAFLESLGRVEKERLLYGSWFAREESAGYFKRDWTEVIPLAPMRTIQRVRAWDISGTLPSDKNPNPDWTAGVLMSKDKNSLYYVEDVVRDRRLYGGVFDLILETARRDGVETTILIPCDPGAAGKAYAAQIIRELAEYGYVARMKQTNQSKVTRFAPFSALSEAGGVRIVRGEWNDEYLDELERFDGTRNIKDDMVDATGDAFTHLASNIHIPNFMPPDMTQTNPFAIYK